MCKGKKEKKNFLGFFVLPNKSMRRLLATAFARSCSVACAPLATMESPACLAPAAGPKVILPNCCICHANDSFSAELLNLPLSSFLFPSPADRRKAAWPRTALPCSRNNCILFPRRADGTPFRPAASDGEKRLGLQFRAGVSAGGFRRSGRQAGFRAGSSVTGHAARAHAKRWRAENKTSINSVSLVLNLLGVVGVFGMQAL